MIKSGDLAALIQRVAQERGVPAPALLAACAPLMRTPRPFDVFSALFVRKADDVIALRNALLRPAADEAQRRFQAAAISALEAGRFAELDKGLAQVELRLLDGKSDLGALPPAHRTAAGEARADRAATSVLLTTPDSYREAAQRYGEASAIIGFADLPRSHALALAQIDALARISVDFGGRDGLDAAIGQAKRNLEGLDGLSEPVSFGSAQALLAESLTALADITGEMDLRAEALAAARAGLEDLRRTEAPDLWRKLQGLLGAAAAATGGATGNEALLEEAVTALAAALAGWDRERHGPGWLDLERHIARARAGLGAKFSDMSLLERAFNSFNRIAASIDRKRDPLQWAALQDDMGSVLAAMGERYRETVVLEEAVSAFGLALEERRRDTHPLLWATSAGNQALVTMRLAARRQDAELARTALNQIATAIQAMNEAGSPAGAEALKRRLAGADKA